MSDYRGLKWMRDRQEDNARQILEEFAPSSGWTQDSEFHYLLVDLPGYKRGDIKLQIDNSGTIAISGEQLKGEGKHEHFGKVFTVPKDSDIENISMKFEGETLRVNIPRVTKESKEKETRNRASSIESKEEKGEVENLNGKNLQKTDETEKEQQNSHIEEKNSQDDPREDSKHGETSQKSVIWMVIDCKEIVLASILSFTLGFFLSQKIQHPPK